MQKNTKKQSNTKNKTSYAFMEDIVRHNIAQMTSTNKAYISYLLFIMMSYDYMRQVSTPLWWSLRIIQKTYDTRTLS